MKTTKSQKLRIPIVPEDNLAPFALFPFEAAILADAHIRLMAEVEKEKQAGTCTEMRFNEQQMSMQRVSEMLRAGLLSEKKMMQLIDSVWPTGSKRMKSK